MSVTFYGQSVRPCRATTFDSLTRPSSLTHSLTPSNCLMSRNTGSGGGGGGGGGGRKEGKSSHKPHFVRQVPNFLKQYETMLGTNKKNYLNETVKKEGRSFKSVDDAIADGATVFDPHARSGAEEEVDEVDEVVASALKEASEGVSEGVSEVASVKVDEKEKEQEQVRDEKEYFKDGKILFNKASAEALSRKRKVPRVTTGDNDDEDDVAEVESSVGGEKKEGSVKKTKKQKKKKLELLSFDTSDDC
jgi:hypothetical protein